MVSALGLARAAIGAITDRTEARLDPLIVRLQRELFVVGAELATHTDRRDRLTQGTTLVTAEMVSALETEIDALEATQEMPAEFVLPGESMTGAALDPGPQCGATGRASDRRPVQAGELPDSHVLAYLEPPGRPALRHGARRGWVASRQSTRGTRSRCTRGY